MDNKLSKNQLIEKFYHDYNVLKKKEMTSDEFDEKMKRTQKLIKTRDRNRHFADTMLYFPKVIENIKNIVSEQVKSSFDLKRFSEKVIDEYNRKFTASQWEEVIKNILEKIYPGYEIERIGGSKEEKHGTDILVTISGLSNLEKYNIAMQVKN